MIQLVRKSYIVAARFCAALKFAILVGCVIANSCDAGIISDFRPDSEYQARGAEYAGPYRGPAMSPSGGALAFSLQYELPGFGTVTRSTSATWINERYAITGAHNLSDILQYNPRMSTITGPNYFTNPGTVVAVENVLIHPSYAGAGAGGNSMDLAILRFGRAVAGGSEMVFANSLPTQGSLINAAGYGVSGTPSGGAVYPGDGHARGGVLEMAQSFAPLGGLSQDLYKSTIFRNSPTNLYFRPYFGDTGAPSFNFNNELLGIWIGGASSASGSFSTFLDLTPSDRQNYIRSNTLITAVPEPGSILLLVVGSVAVLNSRRLRNKYRTAFNEPMNLAH